MKSKQKIVYICQNCGAQRPRWEGKCPECGSWNSLIEEIISESLSSHKTKGWLIDSNIAEPQYLNKLQEKTIQLERYPTNILELDRVLSGGLVQGSLILMGGAPGIGKSTLLIQMFRDLSPKAYPVLYISGEESSSQTADRAQRLGISSNKIMIFNESNLNEIIKWIQKINPKILVIDSIQTLYHPDLSGAPGTVSQVRECTAQLLNLAKTSNITIILVGHITKEGMIAGPKVLEHMVDVVLYFEGDEHQTHRLLRVTKNRFGSTNELGIFKMTHKGLEEVTNPSEIFIEQKDQSQPGSVVFCSLEGTRPLLCEIQSLNVKSFYPSPRRTSVGFDLQRLFMLLAVLERHLMIPISDQDIYVNVVGGFEIKEPAADLAVICSIFSTINQKILLPKLCVVGEVGLTGEVRNIPQVELRVKEAVRLGFEHMIVPFKAQKTIEPLLKENKISIHLIKHVAQIKHLITRTPI